LAKQTIHETTRNSTKILLVVSWIVLDFRAYYTNGLVKKTKLGHYQPSNAIVPAWNTGLNSSDATPRSEQLGMGQFSDWLRIPTSFSAIELSEGE